MGAGLRAAPAGGNPGVSLSKHNSGLGMIWPQQIGRLTDVRATSPSCPHQVSDWVVKGFGATLAGAQHVPRMMRLFMVIRPRFVTL